MGDPNSNPNDWAQRMNQQIGGGAVGGSSGAISKKERKNNGQLRKLREEKINVLRKMKAADLVWKLVVFAEYSVSTNIPVLPFPITFQSPVVIQVCQVVKVDGLYLPVTAKETWEFARQFRAFPLTRAVADRMFLEAAPIDPKTQNIIKEGDSTSDSGYDEMFDFEKQSEYLESKNYKGIADFGAHKIWALSKRKASICQATPKATTCVGDKGRIAINHGLYFKGTPQPGTLLASYNSKYKAIQNIGAKHDDAHWDYSQLLQLMRGVVPIPFKDKSGTTLLDMKSALINGHPILWDEPQMLTESDLTDFG